MLNILKLAAVAGVASEVKRRAAYAAQMALRGAAAALLVVSGGVFLVAAGWLKLESLYGALNANLMVGSALMAIGLLVYVLGVFLPQHYRRRYAAPSQGTLGVGAAPGATSGVNLSALATLAAVGVAAGRMFRR